MLLVAGFWAARGIASGSGASIFASFLTQLAGCALLTLFFLGWWSFHRRIPRGERLAGLLPAAGGGVLAAVLAPAGTDRFAWLLTSLPWVFTLAALWMLAARGLPSTVRRSGLVAVLLLTWGSFTLIRLEGIGGDGSPVMHWRWTPTSESLYLAELARARDAPSARVPERDPPEFVSGPDDWPGFRGPDRSGEARGIRPATDWNADPPELLWRRKIGPAWSSLAFAGGRLFTQEQRGDSEAVVCLDAGTGGELWAHLENVRFQEDLGGAGPRATPTVEGDRLFAMGATGLLNCLDARTGARIWSRNVAADSGAETPIWGFSSSPLVVGERVVVFAGGDGERSLRAYAASTGEPLWNASGGTDSYSSPQTFELEGQTQLLFFGASGLSAVDPASGELLWRFAPRARGMMPPCLQPHAIGAGRFLVADQAGTTALEVHQDGAAWRATELWTSRALKPSFDDFVVHDGFLYGFDSGIFCCVDARSGERRWKEGRYGYGQVLLVPAAALLLVASETGAAVLLAADPERHRELGRFQALTGKTWNHPVLAGGRLVLRNGEELACYRLMLQ